MSTVAGGEPPPDVAPKSWACLSSTQREKKDVVELGKTVHLVTNTKQGGLVHRSSRELPDPCAPSLRHILLSYVASIIIMAPKAAAAKPKPKVRAVKALVITVDAVDENGRPRGLLERAKIIAQKRRPKKPLTDLFTKLAEKSTVDISQVRKVYEAIEAVLTSDLKEHGVLKFPGLATPSRKELPARPDMGE